MIHKLTTYADPILDRQIKELELSLKPLTGSGDPTGTVTPRWLGDQWFDSTGSVWYVSTGVTSADWQLVGSGGGGSATGNIDGGNASSTYMLSIADGGGA